MNRITDADIAIFESATKTRDLSLEQFRDWLQQRLTEASDEAWNDGWSVGHDAGYYRGFDDGRD